MKPEQSKLEITKKAFVLMRNRAHVPEHVPFESVHKITALRRDLLTEDLIGIRFDLDRGAYEIYEDTDGFWELWEVVPKIFGFPKESLDNFYKSGRMSDLEIVWIRTEKESDTGTKGPGLDN